MLASALVIYIQGLETCLRLKPICTKPRISQPCSQMPNPRSRQLGESQLAKRYRRLSHLFNVLYLVSSEAKAGSWLSDILFFAVFIRSQCFAGNNLNVHISLLWSKVIKHPSMPIKPCEELGGSCVKVSRDTVFAFLYPWDKSRSLSFADFVLCIWKCCWSRSKPEEARGVLFCVRVFWGLGLLIQQNKAALASFFSCTDPLGISLAIPAPEKGSSFANHLALFGSETHSEAPCVCINQRYRIMFV